MADVGLMVEEIFDLGERVEILNGEIVSMPPEGALHAYLKVELYRFLAREISDQHRVASGVTLHLSPTDAPDPDLYVFDTGARLEPVDPAHMKLVIEIANNTLGYDLGRKAVTYAQYGVPEYWVVDINARRTHVLRKPDDGAYHEITAVAFDAELAPERIPGVRLRISGLPNLD